MNKLIALILTALLFFTACEKDPIQPNPNPTPPIVEDNYFKVITSTTDVETNTIVSNNIQNVGYEDQLFIVQEKITQIDSEPYVRFMRTKNNADEYYPIKLALCFVEDENNSIGSKDMVASDFVLQTHLSMYCQIYYDEASWNSIINTNSKHDTTLIINTINNLGLHELTVTEAVTTYGVYTNIETVTNTYEVYIVTGKITSRFIENNTLTPRKKEFSVDFEMPIFIRKDFQ